MVFTWPVFTHTKEAAEKFIMKHIEEQQKELQKAKQKEYKETVWEFEG